MPISPEATARLMAPLVAIRPITSRKMFGGLGIYCDGVFFAVIDDDRLYFKFDELTRPDYEAFQAEQWVTEGENGGAMPYFEVPTAIHADPIQLGVFVDAAVGVALRKKTKSKSKNR